MNLKKVKEIEGEVCLSVYHSFEQSSLSDSKRFSLEIKHLLKRMIAKLAVVPEPFTKDHIAKLEKLMEKVGPRAQKSCLVLFYSKSVQEFAWIPEDSLDTVFLGDYFLTDVYSKWENPGLNYWVLSLSKQEAHLYRGHNDQLNELKNNTWPVENVEQYEKGDGKLHKDLSKLADRRLKAFLKEVDQKLSKELTGRRGLVWLVASEPVYSSFPAISTQGHRLKQGLSGNVENNKQEVWRNLLWKKVVKEFKTPEKAKV